MREVLGSVLFLFCAAGKRTCQASGTMEARKPTKKVLLTMMRYRGLLAAAAA